jgi:NADH:ubiquinone oxidoreductase subunit 5 (subunit L)/multisubunit Na+/H+ antiporter MnhA subunit
MISDFLDEYFNYKMLLRGLKRDIWQHSYELLNNKYNEAGADMPFTHFFVSLITFFICVYYSFPYIFENIVFGKKSDSSSKKPNDSVKSLFKGMELISDEEGINWGNVLIVMMLIVLIIQLLILNYRTNHININGVEFTRTKESGISTKIEQQPYKYYYTKRFYYAV